MEKVKETNDKTVSTDQQEETPVAKVTKKTTKAKVEETLEDKKPKVTKKKVEQVTTEEEVVPKAKTEKKTVAKEKNETEEVKVEEVVQEEPQAVVEEVVAEKPVVVEEVVVAEEPAVVEEVVVSEEPKEPLTKEVTTVSEKAKTVVETKEVKAGDANNRNRRGRFEGNRGDNRRDRRQGDRREQEKEFEERVVIINRVTKVVKGGRRFRFSALVVVGDKKGRVGMGTGKANEVPDAIKKAIENAKKNVFRVPIVGTTLPHVANGRYGAGQVFIKPASEGTGVIAGGPVRAVLELAGVQDALTKCIGSRTAINMVRATVQGLKSLRTLNMVAKLRDLPPEEVRK